MRKIIFRGQRKDNKEWVEGDYVCLKDGDRLIPHIYGYGEVIPETVGQFTGLKDKNGKRIFEGDIIDTPDRLIKVVWLKGNAQFDLNFIKFAHDKEIVNFKGINMRDLYSYEVIGNIHSNPELLE